MLLAKIIAIAITITIGTVFIIKKINKVRYPKDVELETNQETINYYPIFDSYGEISQIAYESAQGFHMIPREKGSIGIIIVFGGSEGGCNYDTAYKLYKEGYEVLAMYFFGRKNQPKKLSLVDISFYKDIEEYIQSENLDRKVLTVLGHSKGAELALLLTQYYNIDNLVLYAPSAFTFQGLDIQKPASSWSYKGVELPYCSFEKSKLGNISIIGSLIFDYPSSYLRLYKSISKNVGETDKEWIYKRKIPGEILVFAGRKDKSWHAAEMGKMLKKANSEQVKLHIYEKAGHVFKRYTYYNDMKFGGTAEYNIKAGIESDEVMFENLRVWHK